MKVVSAVMRFFVKAVSVCHANKAYFSSRVIPECGATKKDDVMKLRSFLSGTKRLLVLSGAGVSTESGIPDYRSAKIGRYSRPKPLIVDHQEFMHSAGLRRRYWARNFLEWTWFCKATPNRSHEIIADWEQKNKLSWLITQNVDGLHSMAGSQKVTELHGCRRRVRCMKCKELFSRDAVQTMMEEQNFSWNARFLKVSAETEVNLTEDEEFNFNAPSCPKCGGFMKPDVVFFGDSVPEEIMLFLKSKVHEADSMLVLGSSLMVNTGFYFVQLLKSSDKPLAIVNINETKADHFADVKISAVCGEILTAIGCDW
ncbi:unnamed protein product [Soboliphyme baturini]|uniref:Deacetylase sirtuin-type domain-containing protein n=1 Tax=Soboliphyme baturini TaxID=241478 RepID=A0A183J073_9BILA|nr:unnamed protein product [Soboliphyme baturini]